MMHDFKERLAFSEQHQHDDFWIAIYKKAFRNMVSQMSCYGDNQSQRLGIDRIIHLSSGKTLNIEEKLRETVYDDICLEYLSNDRTGAIGWIEKELLTDYFAYAFLPIKKVYLFPWVMLQRAWFNKKHEWLSFFKCNTADNKTYKTHFVSIPINILIKTVAEAQIIQI